MSATAQAPSTAPVYLDYAATTPVDPRVAATMAQYLTFDGAFANPTSTHPAGVIANAAIEHARAQVAALIGASPASIVWTSCATEANNLAILGTARHLQRARRTTRQPLAPGHIITSRTEHKSVLEPCRQLEKEGWRITYLTPPAGGAGTIEPLQVADAFTADTVLVSLMHVNNETGAINDIATIGRLCRERGVPFHVDAAQSAGKLPVDVESACIDLLSLSAHKLYGPKGIGALYARKRTNLEPLMSGGGHEQGLRPGTLATHQIAGFGLASEIAAAQAEADTQRILTLRQRLWHGLSAIGGVLPNPATSAQTASTVPHILNLSFEGVEGESLRTGLLHLSVSSGSTCNSATAEPSYVLRTLGRSDVLAEASLRLSLGRFTTEADIDNAIEIITHTVQRLRQLSPANPLPPDANTLHTGEAGSERQGTWIRWLLNIEHGRIKSARHQAWGCPHTLAACEWLQTNLPGRATDNPLPEGPRALLTAAHAPQHKLGRMLIVEDALKAATTQ